MSTGAPAPWEPAVVDRRFTADAEAHRRDAPRYCPQCAGSLSLATEFWEGDDRRFYCWCGSCDWTGEVITTGATAVGHEPRGSDAGGAGGVGRTEH